MIEINLLPEDLRRGARKAGPSRAGLAAGAALLVLAAGVVYFHVAHIGPRSALHRQLSDQLSGLERKTGELATLQAAVSHVEKRKRALAELYSERILWSEKLDQLLDIVPPNVWLDEIRLTLPRGTRRAGDSGGTLVLECYSAGTDEKGITLFRERYRGHEAFWADFARDNRIEHTRRDFPEYVEGVALAFSVDLELKSRQAAAVKPAPKTPRPNVASR